MRRVWNLKALSITYYGCFLLWTVIKLWKSVSRYHLLASCYSFMTGDFSVWYKIVTIYLVWYNFNKGVSWPSLGRGGRIWFHSHWLIQFSSVEFTLLVPVGELFFAVQERAAGCPCLWPGQSCQQLRPRLMGFESATFQLTSHWAHLFAHQ